MMKISFSIITLLITTTSFSQLQVGVFAGPLVTGVRYMINDSKQESSLKYGANFGVQFKAAFENRLSFAPSISYNLKGYKVKFDAPSFPPDSSAINNDTRFHTIELCFLFQHDFKIEPGHFFFRIGPALDFVLTGKETYNTKSSATVSRNMKFGFAEYGHYLASAILHFGYEAKNGWYIYGLYDYGIISMNNFDDGPTILNRAAGINVGKYLGKK